jgi:hypothetical protein
LVVRIFSMYTADLTRPVVECAVPPKIADVAAFLPRLLLSLVFVDSMSLSGKRRVRNCSNHTERDTPRAATVRLGHINRPETAGDGLTRLSQSISVSPGCALVPAVGSEVAPAR